MTEPDEVVLPENKWKTLSKDSKYLKTLVDQFVTIKMIANYSYCGYVHSIDPISKSIILSAPKDDSFQPILILGHLVLDVTKTTPTNEKKPTRKLIPILTQEAELDRKNMVIAWFKKNFIPVKEKDNVIDLGNVSILPPYTTEDLCTDNPIVAGEIKKILERMPENIEA